MNRVLRGRTEPHAKGRDAKGASAIGPVEGSWTVPRTLAWPPALYLRLVLDRPQPRPHVTADELPDGVPLGPSPFLCLLDDDALITKVSIETFGLLTPPGAGEDADYVELDIGVDVVPVTPMWATLDWLFP